MSGFLYLLAWVGVALFAFTMGVGAFFSRVFAARMLPCTARFLPARPADFSDEQWESAQTVAFPFSLAATVISGIHFALMAFSVAEPSFFSPLVLLALLVIGILMLVVLTLYVLFALSGKHFSR